MAEAPLVHIVDDDASVRDSLMVLLESAGYAVRAYDLAVAFLQAASDRTAGCVLTDVQMPELNGLELQRRMSEQGIRLPVIVMTGHGDVPIAVEAMKAGAADFLEKPFGDEQLLTAVSGAVAINRRVRDEAAAVADTMRRLATLTPREREGTGPPGGRSAEQDDRVRSRLQPTYCRSAPGARHGEDGCPQPAGAGAHDDRGGTRKSVGPLT